MSPGVNGFMLALGIGASNEFSSDETATLGHPERVIASRKNLTRSRVDLSMLAGWNAGRLRLLIRIPLAARTRIAGAIQICQHLPR